MSENVRTSHTQRQSGHQALRVGPQGWSRAESSQVLQSAPGPVL